MTCWHPFSKGGCGLNSAAEAKALLSSDGEHESLPAEAKFDGCEFA